ncbi:hypothetical protein LCGC14_0757000 [marine sediment metagenome]|uniref:Uncharacterized protein n=1 Tax=marine sediment metagenome TaxID=412755 RepID=A0A0F9Q2C0_9ZZZZ
MKGKGLSLSKSKKRVLSLISIPFIFYIPITLIFNITIYIDVAKIVAIMALFFIVIIAMILYKKQAFSNRNSGLGRRQNKFGSLNRKFKKKIVKKNY